MATIGPRKQQLTRFKDSQATRSEVVEAGTELHNIMDEGAPIRSFIVLGAAPSGITAVDPAVVSVVLADDELTQEFDLRVPTGTNYKEFVLSHIKCETNNLLVFF